MRLNLPVIAVEQAFGGQQRLIRAAAANRHITHRDAEKASQPSHNAAATVQKTACNVNAAAIRGRELESISSGLRALVERFNR
ncbi:hypothetical protein [Pseudomonas mucidolens]|uniref:hypothetical protein n=1 Tax=Pseudomonas mucidolens TaxID=46679 RepID=UPI0009FC206F|nr:hypothetical protein [Pseudomonas mucidolens]SQH32660.1 aerotaxis receptor [Pseudomonas mucidolens]